MSGSFSPEDTCPSVCSGGMAFCSWFPIIRPRTGSRDFCVWCTPSFHSLAARGKDHLRTGTGDKPNLESQLYSLLTLNKTPCSPGPGVLICTWETSPLPSRCTDHRSRRAGQRRCPSPRPRGSRPVPGLGTLGHCQGGPLFLPLCPGARSHVGLVPSGTSFFLNPSSACVCFVAGTLLSISHVLTRALL